MSNLTNAQIATFDKFAAAVEEYLNEHSEGKGSTRLVENKVFGQIWEACSRKSKLGRVMNNVTFLNENGRTKQQYQIRTPDGTPCFRPDGTPVMSHRRCVMYTVEAYREMRRERTGLKTPETFFMVPWEKVPGWLQSQLGSKFPKALDTAPEFTPKQIGILLRKGDKPKSGEKRNTWAGLDFLVVGTYGDDPVVITQAAVQNRPYIETLAEIVGCDCPDWGQNDAQEAKEDLTRAASGLMQNAIDITDIDELL
jgi:hypothetical protein